MIVSASPKMGYVKVGLKDSLNMRSDSSPSFKGRVRLISRHSFELVIPDGCQRKVTCRIAQSGWDLTGETACINVHSSRSMVVNFGEFTARQQ